ncbi:MAG: hypothetical protein IPO66_02775 [Rhodanobacteraceae bacterium]|nr:hypothetical protein [Rhodanobacteraceae bacterium]
MPLPARAPTARTSAACVLARACSARCCSPTSRSRAKAGVDGKLDIAIYASAGAGIDDIMALIVPDGAGAQGPAIELRRVDALNETTPPPVGLFLATPLTETQLARAVDWSIRNQVILYSPFEGDVERGATAGLSIEAKVLPFVNQHTLSASGVELKPFFLKVARVHQ